LGDQRGDMAVAEVVKTHWLTDRGPDRRQEGAAAEVASSQQPAPRRGCRLKRASSPPIPRRFFEKALGISAFDPALEVCYLVPRWAVTL